MKTKLASTATITITTISSTNVKPAANEEFREVFRLYIIGN